MTDKLLEHNSFDKDFLKWFKKYSVFKLYDFDHTNVNNDFDVVELEDKMLDNSIDTVEKLHKVNNFINNKGLKQMATISIAISKFYNYIIKENIKSFDKLNSEHIEYFVNKICIDKKLQYGSRNNYKNTLIAFLTFVSKTNTDKFKFSLEKIDVISNSDDKKYKIKLTDWLDSDMVKLFIKNIVSYPFQNDFEKCRDILIARLFICSGIELNELVKLTRDSFIFETNSMSIRIKKTSSRHERIIPLPKAFFIKYYKRYLELKETETNLFFYGFKDSSKPIETNFVRTIIERLITFVFGKDKIRDKTPQMLRKSYIIYIHNEKDENGFTQPLKNVQYLSGIENITDLKRTLLYSTIDVVTASSVFDKLNIK